MATQVSASNKNRKRRFQGVWSKEETGKDQCESKEEEEADEKGAELYFVRT